MRVTFSQVEKCNYKIGMASALLGVSKNTLYQNLKNSGIEIKRQDPTNPNSPRGFSLENVFQLAAWRRNKANMKTTQLMPIFIAISSMHSGAGKSTTAAELGVQLQLSGLKVLMIDLDVDANLTQYIGYEPDLEYDEAAEYNLMPEAIIQRTFFDACKPCLNAVALGTAQYEDVTSQIKWPFGPHGPAIIAADPFLGYTNRGVDAEENTVEIFFPNFFRDSAEGKIPGLRITDFDVVLFDCPSSHSFAVANAFSVANSIVSPAKVDAFAKKGLLQIACEVKRRAGKSDRSPELIFLPTHRSDLIPKSIRMWKELHAYKDNLSDISIGSSTMFVVAQQSYIPLTLQQPNSPPVIEYRNFTKYLLQRFVTLDERCREIES